VIPLTRDGTKFLLKSKQNNNFVVEMKLSEEDTNIDNEKYFLF
jgi:hypothetical protein